jgi:hypothetical protein
MEGSSGVYIRENNNSLVAFCTIYNCNPKSRELENGTDDGNGIYFFNGSDGGLCYGNLIKNCGRRAIKIQSSGITAVNNEILDCARAAIQIQLEPEAGGPIKDIAVVNCYIKKERHGNYGVMLESHCKNILLSGLIIENVYAGIEVRHGVESLNIISCKIRNTEAWGIRIEQLLEEPPPFTKNIHIANCLIKDCGNYAIQPAIEIRPGKAAIDSVSIINCRIEGNKRQAVLIREGGHKNIYIFGNEMKSIDFKNRPISIDSSVKGVSTTNNRIIRD